MQSLGFMLRREAKREADIDSVDRKLIWVVDACSFHALCSILRKSCWNVGTLLSPTSVISYRVLLGFNDADRDRHLDQWDIVPVYAGSTETLAVPMHSDASLQVSSSSMSPTFPNENADVIETHSDWPIQ